MKKILLVFSIVSSMILSTIPSALAYDNNSYYELSDEELLISQRKAYEDMVAKYEGSNNARSSSSYEYKYDPVETVVTDLCAYKNATNQPNGGTMWNSKGSGFYWKESSYSPGNFSVDVGFAYKAVSVSIAYTPGTVIDESTAYFTAIKDNQVGKYVKLQVAKKYSVTHYKIYRKIRTESTWTYIGDEYPAATYARAFRTVVV